MASASAISLELDAEIRERVERLAAKKHMAVVEMIREAVEEYVTREEMREQFKQQRGIVAVSMTPERLREMEFWEGVQTEEGWV